MILTDKVRNVEAVRETTGGSVSRVVNAVRVVIGTGSGSQVVVVAVVDERVSEDEESSGLSLKAEAAQSDH